MKYYLIFLLILGGLYSCLDRDLPNVNGMWKLETIETEEGKIQKIDTIFYSFQRQAIFSYTLLKEISGRPASAQVLYGYISFPQENILSIEMDEKYNNFTSFPYLDKNMNYTIYQLSSKKMILYLDGSTYHFSKY